MSDATANTPLPLTRLLLTSFTVFLLPHLSFAEFFGPVVSVLDGDTIEVLHN
jgi:hypothetical protein